jgi:hypothetical protein
VWYVFATNALTELEQPAVAIRLADHPAAAKIAVRYAYTQYALSPIQNLALPLVKDCGIGSCSLPVDRLLGPIYLQILYLDASGKIIAIGDLTTL